MLLISAKEHLNSMGLYQWTQYSNGHQHPLYGQEPNAVAARSMAGNVTLLALLRTLHCVHKTL